MTETKKRLAGSCDRCRKKKVKCDSATTQDRFCSKCIASNAECTHADLIKRRGSITRQDSPPATRSSKRHGPDINYVLSLEQRVNQLECMLKEVNLDVNLPKETAGKETSPQGVPIFSTSQQAIQSSENTELAEDFLHPELSRYYGRSSSFSLFTDAISITKKSTGNGNMVQFRDHFDLQPWEQATADAEIPHYVYPDNDLILSLITIYFETINSIIPILHQPTFEKHVNEGGFTILLMIREFWRSPARSLSSGWRFFEQVHIFQIAICDPPSLYDLQVAVLGGIYALGTSVPELSWTMIGVGLRSAIDIGLHRRKPESYRFTVEDELKKRSFWALIVLDRLIGLYVGYPAMIQDEELDLQTPIECDDEYWEIAPDGQVHFNQPPSKPSKISYFNASIKLSEIMSVVMKTSCSLKKARDMLGLTGKSWEQRLVADLDSSLNAWMDSVPDHLRWNPKCDNGTFLHQSAALYSVYYMLQILIHRPFLRRDSPLSMPSLIICTNAARSCTQTLKVHMTRTRILNPQIIVGAFTSGAVFAMNIWSRKRAGRAPNVKDVAGFQVCLSTFEDAADTWNLAGRSLILFRAMASVESPSTHRHESVTVTPVPNIWSSQDTVPQTSLPQSVQPFCEQTPYLDDYLGSQMGAGFPLPLEPRLQVSSSVQPSYHTTESGLSREPSSIDMWTDAPLGFSFSEWNDYVTSMVSGHNGRPR
ncbi:fungal-specific transcription factor domain-containing protein [Armillaria mellea]|nr:fungal-specific transcription factor domain-containing protein [Armillaria mellea]